MAKVTSIDHLHISVGNLKKSKIFYGGLLKFLGFEILGEYEGSVGWTNKETRLWISRATKRGKKHKFHMGNVGFNHYAFRLGSRKDVYDLQKYLKKTKTKIVDPAGKYYEDYFAVYFKDPDGLKFEGMWYDG